MKVLDKIRKQQAEYKLASGRTWENEKNLVFVNETGGHLIDNTVLKHLKAIVTKIGIPETRFHDLRHTYATNAIRIGDPIKTVSENLGHATVAFTLDIYGHVSFEYVAINVRSSSFLTVSILLMTRMTGVPHAFSFSMMYCSPAPM